MIIIIYINNVVVRIIIYIYIYIYIYVAHASVLSFIVLNFMAVDCELDTTD